MNSSKALLAILLVALNTSVSANEENIDVLNAEYEAYVERFNSAGKERVQARYAKGFRFCSSRGGVASFESGYQVTVCRDGSIDVNYGRD